MKWYRNDGIKLADVQLVGIDELSDEPGKTVPQGGPVAVLELVQQDL